MMAALPGTPHRFRSAKHQCTGGPATDTTRAKRRIAIFRPEESIASCLNSVNHGFAFRSMDGATHLEIYTTSDGQTWGLSRSDEMGLISSFNPLAWSNSKTISMVNHDHVAITIIVPA
jgi:hypothetical protein